MPPQPIKGVTKDINFWTKPQTSMEKQGVIFMGDQAWCLNGAEVLLLWVGGRMKYDP